MSDLTTRSGRIAALKAAAKERVLILDGSWGVLLQGRGLSEEDFRGERFAAHDRDVKGDPDLLNLSQPQIIEEIHRAYFAAGADISTTNTFTATSIGRADYGLEGAVHDMNVEGARLARQAADEAGGRFVAGSIGPLNVTLSLSPKVDDPSYRAVSFDDVVAAYAEQIRGLREGGVDLLLIETIFDTLNAKAAIFALETLFEEHGRRWPVIVSGTITDASGRTLSGQVTEAFWNSVRHVQPLAVGLNCALGAEELRPYVAELSRVADCFVSAHPNAGLPNAFGEYDQTPGQMAGVLGEFAGSGLVNIVGGCCGTTPEHIAHIGAAIAGLAPRRLPALPR